VHFQAVLTYNPGQMGTRTDIPVAATDDPHVLRIVKEALLREASYREKLWAEADPALGELMHGERVKLAAILSSLLPNDEDEGLRLVAGGGEEGEAVKN
jgi:hypothetical protein